MNIQDIYRAALETVAPQENARMRATLGYQGYKKNPTASASARDIDLEITAIIAESEPIDTVQIARTLGLAPKHVNGRLSNLRSRNIVENDGRRAVKIVTTSVSTRIWRIGPMYEQWRAGAMEAAE